MAVALAVWSVTLEGGKERLVELPTHVRITNISFGEHLADLTARTVVKLTYSPPISEDDEDDEDEDEDATPRITTVLCALTPGKIEQSSVDLIIDPESQPSFQATGNNTVYLTGNYIEQSPENDQSPFGSELGSEIDSEDAHDLRDVSSDVEMHPDDLDDLESDASRFEEVEEESSKAQKRARESDAADTLTKGNKKTKKLKAEDGKAVVVDTDAVKEGGKKVEAEEEKDDKKKKKVKKEKKKAGDTPGEGLTPAKKTITGGIVIEDAVVGTGPMAKKGNTVRMRYVGRLTNGKEFDKNTSGKPFTFHLGKGEVIKGWDEGIVGMQAGGERRLTIPAGMAYGKKASDDIPANSTLIFEVKLLEIK